MPRGADPTLHTKLGRGGLSDVEWTVQLLQMRHGWAEPGLRTTRTREALAAARAAGPDRRGGRADPGRGVGAGHPGAQRA